MRPSHHDIRERKHRFGQRFAEFQHRDAFRLGDARERYSENDGEHRDLQDLIFGYRLRKIFGKHVQKEIVPVHWRCILCADDFWCGRDREAFAGTADVDCGEADEKG